MSEHTAAGASRPRILYCHCAYAKVVPEEVKQQVLARLNAAGVDFQAVPDLCEMSARKDPALKDIAARPETRIAACYPRAVQWLFHAAGSPLSERHKILNMRVEEPDVILDELVELEMEPS